MEGTEDIINTGSGVEEIDSIILRNTIDLYEEMSLSAKSLVALEHYFV